ncbi:DDE-type integrase/transposase/recombinase [Aduncisulcus paluster]|uniref:DDE-type integrase/transposase/recombinase n=1 Tax=Aduncisulcus paluster TaxID=2918883 RepID=A0ABQ5JZ63_9EUKA|nr:DDE-type integrase/transposase/recombinase [Aduncisulcus paluster]
MGKTNGFADFLSRAGAQETVEINVVEVEEDKEDLKTLRKLHGELGHAGKDIIQKTLKKEEIKIDKLQKKLNKVVNSCIYCQKLKNPKPHGHGTLRSFGTWQCVSADTIGPFTEDEQGFKYLVVIVDDFSRFIFIRPTKGISAEEAITCFRNCFAILGTPVRLRTDGGGQYIAAPTEKWLKERKISHKIALPHNHEENGRAERFNREIRKLQRIWLMEKERNWPEFADYAMKTMNGRLNSRSEVSPFEAMFIRTTELMETERSAFHREIITRREDRKEIDEHIRHTDDKTEKTSKKPLEFEEGEEILLKRTKEGKKEHAKLLGPYTVSEKVNDHSYTVIPIKGGEKEEVATRRMVKYQKDDFIPKEKIIEINGKDEEEYSVEKIIRHRHGGKLPLKFLVKWRDYDEEHNTWEYFPTVKDCEALEVYLEKNKALKGKIDKKLANIKLGE